MVGLWLQARRYRPCAFGQSCIDVGQVKLSRRKVRVSAEDDGSQVGAGAPWCCPCLPLVGPRAGRPLGTDALPVWSPQGQATCLLIRVSNWLRGFSDQMGRSPASWAPEALQPCGHSQGCGEMLGPCRCWVTDAAPPVSLLPREGLPQLTRQKGGLDPCLGSAVSGRGGAGSSSCQHSGLREACRACRLHLP